MRRFSVLVVAVALFGWAPDAPADPDPPKANPNEQKFKEEALAKELALLGDPDSLVRAKAVEGVGRVGLPSGAVPLLEKTAGERLAYIVELAAETAVRLDPEAALATAKFLAEKAKSELQSRNAVLALAECPQPDAVQKLYDAFAGSGSKAVRLAVLEAVGRRGFAAAADFVRKALSSSDLDEKNQAAVAAGRLKLPEFVTPLFAALETTDGDHCMFAAQALCRIGGPDVFPQIATRLGSASGKTGEAKAKVLEGSARPEDAARLADVLRTSSSREYLEAAAAGLGRLGANTPEIQDLLLMRMLRDGDRGVRGAAWHALSRVADDAIVATLSKRAAQRDPEMMKYVYFLFGDLKVEAAAPLLHNVMLNEKDDLARYAAAINFWKTANREAVAGFEESMLNGKGKLLERGIEALGFRKNEEGFRFLLRLLDKFRDGSSEQFLVEKALERITGHFFGPETGIWRKWFEKNPKFFTPVQGEIERTKWREEFDRENQGFRQTEETERSVQLGLEFLARHQSADGRFDPQRFFENCDERPACPKTGGARVEMDPVGTTALSILAFLGAGYEPDYGKYKSVIRRGLDYLLARQQANGDFLTNDLVGGYNRPIAAQAFGEAFMLAKDPEYGIACQRTIDFVTTIQNSIGGWRYRVGVETTDTSCMSWHLFAFKTAQKAGLEVREIALAGCYRVMDLYSDVVKDHREDYVDIDPAYAYEVGERTTYTYQTGYQNAVWDTKYATVPLGVMCRIFLGWRRSHPFNIGSANKILAEMMEEIPKNGDWSKYVSRREYPTYAWYYGTLAMHQMGGRYFRRWNETIQQVVPNTQVKAGCSRGSWPGWNHDMFSWIYTTCMGALTLETYYRYLPVLQD